MSLRVAARVPANTHDEVLLSVPVETEAVCSGAEVDAATRPVVLLVVRIGSGLNHWASSANGEVSKSLGQGMIVAHDKVHRTTLLKR